MGFFSNLFKKKSEKLTKEQIDNIEEKVEESEDKHLKDRLIFSNLSKPKKSKVKKTVKKIAKRPKKQSKKKAKR